MKLKQIFFYTLISIVLVSFLGFTKKDTRLRIIKSKIQLKLEEYKIANENNLELDFAFKEFKLDSMFRSLNYANKFNGCVLVAQYGKVIYRNSFGIANPILQEPLQNNSVFQLASVSKTITGVSILQLIDNEKIYLDDSYSLYFPSFPYPNITIRNLLSHTSGVPDYIKMNTSNFPSKNQYLNNDDVLSAMIHANLPLSFTPGTRYTYNNSNYALLALLVEKVSGESFPNYVANHIFKPLEMNNSYIAYPEEVWQMSNRTFGFNKSNRINENDRYDGVFGDKGAYSTIDDMFKFDRALYPDVLLSKRVLDMAFTNNLFEVNTKKQYGLGFRLREDQNHQKIIFHNGWWHGYRTAFHRRESDNSCVIILSNRLDYVVYSKAKEIFNILDNYYPDMYTLSTSTDDSEE